MQKNRIQRWMVKPNHKVTVGLISPSGRHVWLNGEFTSEEARLCGSIYEIGSVTKTFIGLLLAIGEEKGLWKNSDLLSDMIPKWASLPFAQQTTLLDLVTHTSGLPRLPHNIKGTVKDQLDPYANYDKNDLIEAVLTESAKEKRSFNYSNYGFGILGYLLSQNLGQSLHDGLSEMIFNPLKMKNTGDAGHINNSETILSVYNPKGVATPRWIFQDTMAGAGAINSTVTDMLNYIEANLSLHGDNMASALKQSHNEHFAIHPSKGIGIGYGWLRYKEKDGSVTHWHNGGTYGSNSYATFNRDNGVGFVILSNYGMQLRSQLPLIGAGKLNADKLAKLFLEAIFN